MKETGESGYDHVLLLSVFLLCCLGVLVAYSSSVHLANFRSGDHSSPFLRQCISISVGFSLMIVIKNIYCGFYPKIISPLLILNFILLVMVLIPDIGHRVSGASRVFSLMSLTIQPSELLKVSLAIYMACAMSKKGAMKALRSRGLTLHIMVVSLFLILLIFQPDFGTAILIGIWLLLFLYIRGVRASWILLIFLVFVIFSSLHHLSDEYRRPFLFSFLHPDSGLMKSNLIHSIYSFGSGSIFGTGIGNSKHMLMTLPEAYTDFAFAVIAEEMGLLGAGIVVLLFTVFIWRGIQIALKARDVYSSYLALGLVIMTGLQAVMNMLIVMTLLPIKGLALPFISNDGSSLIFNLIGVGILLNIAQETG